MKIKKLAVPLKALAVGTLASLVLSACGGSGDADSGSDDAIKIAVFPSFNALGARTAALEGIFEKQGLTVEMVTVATPGEATPQLLGGKIDFALMDMVSPIIAKTEGVELVMVAPGATGTEPAEPGGMAVGNFWVREGSPITTVKDIENTTFGIPQTKGQLWLDVREAVDSAGGDSSKIKFVEVPNTLAALKSGSVDVVTTSEPSGTKALGETGIERLGPFVSAGGDLAYSFVTTPRYAAENAGTVTKFTDAIVEANKLLGDRPELPAQIAATYIEADPDLLARSIYPKFLTSAITESNIATAIDRMVRYGLIEKSAAPSPDDMIAGS